MDADFPGLFSLGLHLEMSSPEDDRHEAMVHPMPDTYQPSPLATGTNSLHSNFWL